MRQGIISNDGCAENCIKFRIDAEDKSASNTQDNAISVIYGDKFIITLDFEMLDSVIPYYQSGLGNRLCCEIMFNDYDRVIFSVRDSSYKISDISLEYEIVACSDLVRNVSIEYQSMVFVVSQSSKAQTNSCEKVGYDLELVI